MRFAYGWSEEQALSLPKGSHVRKIGLPKGYRSGARPGVRLSPLTQLEIEILHLLSVGVTPRQLAEHGLGVNLRAVHSRMDRMRLKLDAFTTWEMTAEGVRRGLIK